MVYYKDLEANQFVMPGSNYHMRMSAQQRLTSLFDGADYQPIEVPDVPVDPLKFRDERRYSERLRDAREETEMKDAVLLGEGSLDTLPIVAAVQGHAVGVGTTMLFHCDLVYVAEHARLTTPFVDLGVVPEAASSLTMPARLGHARAFAMLGLGEPLLGRDAVAAGLANAACPAAEVEPRARAAAHALAKKPAQALKLTKGLMRDREALLARMRHESELFADRLQSPEAIEAFSAFIERRPPDFGKLG